MAVRARVANFEQRVQHPEKQNSWEALETAVVTTDQKVCTSVCLWDCPSSQQWAFYCHPERNSNNVTNIVATTIDLFFSNKGDQYRLQVLTFYLYKIRHFWCKPLLLCNFYWWAPFFWQRKSQAWTFSRENNFGFYRSNRVIWSSRNILMTKDHYFSLCRGTEGIGGSVRFVWDRIESSDQKLSEHFVIWREKFSKPKNCFALRHFRAHFPFRFNHYKNGKHCNHSKWPWCAEGKSRIRGIRVLSNGLCSLSHSANLLAMILKL